jgi:hypothetical protein
MLMGLEGYDEDLAYIMGQLTTLRAALAQVQRYGEQPGTWTLEAIKTRYNVLLGRLRDLQREIYGKEMPSAFMLKLSNVSDGILKFGSDVGKAASTIVSGVTNIASGLGTTGKLLPFILIGALVVLGIGFQKGSLGVSIRR